MGRENRRQMAGRTGSKATDIQLTDDLGRQSLRIARCFSNLEFRQAVLEGQHVELRNENDELWLLLAALLDECGR